jgi:hypothetical protein
VYVAYSERFERRRRFTAIIFLKSGLKYAYKKFQENQEELKFYGLHQIVAYDDIVYLLGRGETYVPQIKSE